ncbi:hypothetical protein [Streptomyces sp. NPDC002851]
MFRPPRPKPCRAAFGLAEQQPTGPGHRGKAEGGPGGPAQRSAVHDKDDGHQDAAEGRPADEVAHGVRRGRARPRRGTPARTARTARAPGTARPASSARPVRVTRGASRTTRTTWSAGTARGL